MKGFFKWILRVLTISLVVILAVVMIPYVKPLIANLLNKTNYSQVAEILSHEMMETGKLTAVEYCDQGEMTSKTDALIIGTVQSVSVPYRYDIALGLDLSRVEVETEPDSLIIYLPSIELISDKLTVTGDAKVNDFLFPLTNKRYQDMLDAYALSCREAYMNNQTLLDEAWTSAAKTLKELFSKWIEESNNLNIRFEKLEQMEFTEKEE